MCKSSGSLIGVQSMISVETVCDKCGRKINGKVYKVDVDFTGSYQYDQMMLQYQSYDICPECMGDVITDDVVGGPYRHIPAYQPPTCFCV